MTGGLYTLNIYLLKTINGKGILGHFLVSSMLFSASPTQSSFSSLVASSKTTSFCSFISSKHLHLLMRQAAILLMVPLDEPLCASSSTSFVCSTFQRRLSRWPTATGLGQTPRPPWASAPLPYQGCLLVKPVHWSSLSSLARKTFSSLGRLSVFPLQLDVRDVIAVINLIN